MFGKFFCMAIIFMGWFIEFLRVYGNKPSKKETFHLILFALYSMAIVIYPQLFW